MEDDFFTFDDLPGSEKAAPKRNNNIQFVLEADRVGSMTFVGLIANHEVKKFPVDNQSNIEFFIKGDPANGWSISAATDELKEYLKARNIEPEIKITNLLRL
jgi:hypothetical protein